MSAEARTRLAWERTGLSLAANAGLLCTAALHRATGLVVLPVALLLLAAAAWTWDRDVTPRVVTLLTIATAVTAAIVVLLPF